MSKAEEVKLQIKVVVNKQRTKVLFAEAGSDFTDILLSFLLLPLGTILKVLEKHNGDEAPAIGSLNALYKGAVNLDIVHFRTEAAKLKLLTPPSCYDTESRKLRLNVNFSVPASPSSVKRYEGVFTESAASFIINDDLKLVPNVKGSFMETLRSLDIDGADMDGAETRNMAFGLKEILALLRESLVSQNPVTVFLLSGRRVALASAKSEKRGNDQLHYINEKVASVNTKKMILKATVQKSTNNGVKAIDNLHRSIEDESKKVELKSAEAKALLTMSSYHHVALNEFSGFKGVRMYMVGDDLSVTPLAMTSCLCVLNGLKVSVSDVEEVELQVGLEEGLSIVKAALTSKTALTDGLMKHMLKKASLTSKSALTGDLVSLTSLKRPKLEC